MVSVAAGLTTPPRDAVIAVVPAATPRATPVVEIAATGCVADAQSARYVRSSVELSMSVPVAVNAWFDPMVIVGFVGVTAIEDKVGGGAMLRV